MLFISVNWMKLFRLVFFIFLTTVICLSDIQAQSDSVSEWKLDKDHDGIIIYTRKVGNYKLKEFKAITTIETSPKVLMDVLREVEHYVDWMSRLAESRILKIENDDKIYVYTESSVPWPFANRDIIILSHLYWEDEVAFVKMTHVPDYIPENKGIVRMPFSKGLWVFKPIGYNTTEITYMFLGEPGGSIPGWLANMFVVDTPYKTLKGLKAFVADIELDDD